MTIISITMKFNWPGTPAQPASTEKVTARAEFCPRLQGDTAGAGQLLLPRSHQDSSVAPRAAQQDDPLPAAGETQLQGRIPVQGEGGPELRVQELHGRLPAAAAREEAEGAQVV